MEVIVIGSGIIGLSVAFDLSLAGHKVKIITRNYEEGASWVAGGMLAPLSEGLEGDLLEFSLYSLNLFSDFIKRLEDVSKNTIFYQRNGILRVPANEEELKSIEAKLPLYEKKGLTYKKLEGQELWDTEPYLSKSLEVGFLFEDEGNVDSERVMDALLIACHNLKVEIILDTITKVSFSQDKVNEVQGYKGIYRGDFYVITTGAWTGALVDVPVFPVKGQILKVKGFPPRRVIYSSLAYVIPKEDYILIGATSEDKGFDTRPTLEGVKSLVDGALALAPDMGDVELLGVKVGFRPGTPDEAPIFDLGDNYALLSGHYRNGILWAPASAKMVADFVERGIKSQFFDVFSPSRFK